MIEKQPFRKYNLKDNPQDVISLKLNPEERAQLNKDKKLMEQKKDGTAIKQLALIGSKVVNDAKTTEIIAIILGNRRRNRRIGIVDFEQE
jgi:hypothetical protein|tara:strand:+ start:5501 stop:5770 length:270 start_codon:yes stop_codon:yes gene_type:complete